MGPFQKAMTLAKKLGGDSSAIDVDTFVILDAKLAKLSTAWRDDCCLRFDRMQYASLSPRMARYRPSASGSLLGAWSLPQRRFIGHI